MNKKYLDKSGLERVSGTINKKLTKNNNMPAASASLLGKFCLYTGENSATFRKGGVYECIHTSSGYKWELRSFNFIGTTSEWNALTLEEKVAYQTADILDDDNKTRYAVNQITGALIPISGGEVSWTGTLSEWSALSLEERAKYDGKKVFITDDYMENIPVMIGASADDDGFKGLVPTPHAGDEDKVLKGDGAWSDLLYSFASDAKAIRFEAQKDTNYCGIFMFTNTDGDFNNCFFIEFRGANNDIRFVVKQSGIIAYNKHVSLS